MHTLTQSQTAEYMLSNPREIAHLSSSAFNSKMASTLGSDFFDEPDAEAVTAAGSGAKGVLSAGPQTKL